MIVYHQQLTPIHRTALACLFSLTLLTACGSEDTARQLNSAPSTPANKPEQVSDPIALGTEAITEVAYRRHVEILASDEFGGRAPGSPGEDLTVDYLVQNFKSLGLEPANGDSYIQDVPLAWVEVSNNPDLLVSGG